MPTMENPTIVAKATWIPVMLKEAGADAIVAITTRIVENNDPLI